MRSQAPVIGWRMRLLELLKRFKGPVIAIASVGAVLSGLVGYWNVYRTVVRRHADLHRCHGRTCLSW